MNNLATNNVARLNQSTVYASIQSFLRNKGVKSKNTEKAYENDLKLFFSYMRNKHLEELTESDLQFRNSDMLNYQTYLYREYVQSNGEKFSNTTINRKINSVISLFRHLKRDDFNVDPDKLKVEELADDTKQIGFLTNDEVNTILSLADDVLKAFITLGLHTSMRKDALLGLKWEQIEPKHDEDGWYIISNFDKGKKVYKEIHESVYELLQKVKVDDVQVFTIPRSTLDYRFKALCKKIGIDPMRKVSLHSIRKAGINFVKQFTGDIHAAQHQASHSSPAVTDKSYVQAPKNLAARLLVEQVDEKIFDQLTHEELLQLVKSQTNGLGHVLRMGAKKIVDGRKE